MNFNHLNDKIYSLDRKLQRILGRMQALRRARLEYDYATSGTEFRRHLLEQICELEHQENDCQLAVADAQKALAKWLNDAANLRCGKGAATKATSLDPKR